MRDVDPSAAAAALPATPETACYLLLAGTDADSEDGSNVLVATFTEEAEARQAFQVLRLSATYRAGRAQLVQVNPDNRLQLCWFDDRPRQATSSRNLPHSNAPLNWPELTAEKESRALVRWERDATSRRRWWRTALSASGLWRRQFRR